MDGRRDRERSDKKEGGHERMNEVREGRKDRSEGEGDGVRRRGMG